MTYHDSFFVVLIFCFRTGVGAALEDDLDDHPEFILNTVVDCCCCLPLKSGVFGCFLGQMTWQASDFAQKVLAKIFERFQEYIRKGKILQAQTILRFLVECSNSRAIEVESLFQMLNKLMELPGDGGIYLVLSALPWMAADTITSHLETVEGNKYNQNCESNLYLNEIVFDALDFYFLL